MLTVMSNTIFVVHGAGLSRAGCDSVFGKAYPACAGRRFDYRCGDLLLDVGRDDPEFAPGGSWRCRASSSDYWSIERAHRHRSSRLVLYGSKDLLGRASPFDGAINQVRIYP